MCEQLISQLHVPFTIFTVSRFSSEEIAISMLDTWMVHKLSEYLIEHWECLAVCVDASCLMLPNLAKPFDDPIFSFLGRVALVGALGINIPVHPCAR